jgi:YHS domain-containing protein
MRAVSVLAVCFIGACAAPAAPNGEARAAVEHHEEQPHEAAPVQPLGTVAAEGAAESAESGGSAKSASSGALTRISDHGGVCMLSNRYLGERADVPIEVEGKTYRGCCANCAARLGSHPETRTASDPVTGKPVDKATAVLARDANNRVFYFESEATLAGFAPR